MSTLDPVVLDEGADPDTICTSKASLSEPEQALDRWEKLAYRDVAIEHAGDASKVIPLPRPSWSDPDYDQVGTSFSSHYYNSSPVLVAATRSTGRKVSTTTWRPAHFEVFAFMSGRAILGVEVRHRKAFGDEWSTYAFVMSPSEALELADVLRAAVDLFGGEQ